MVTGEGFKVKSFNFPVGEMQASVEITGDIRKANMLFEFTKNEDIIELLQVVDALKRQGIAMGNLQMNYIPFSRQDRVNAPGESFSLGVFAELINGCGFEKVLVADPHSDVAAAVIKNCVVLEQYQVFEPILSGEVDFYLISPDAGALKKIFKLAKRSMSIGVIECSKKRDTATGEISGVSVPADDLQGKACYIVDDICDGGRTFTEIAKVLKQKNCGKIVLLVTHGFFTKGLEVFDGLIDEIHTMKGRVK